MPPIAETAIVYFAITIAYWGLIWPLKDWILNQTASTFWPGFKWLLVIYLLPMLLGIVSGRMTRSDVIDRCLKKLGISPVHPAPSAWDRLFSRQRGHYMRVELDDGSFIAGMFGPKSYASSDVSNRDLYLERTTKLDSKGDPIPGQPEPGVYLPAARIKFIYFYGDGANDH